MAIVDKMADFSAVFPAFREPVAEAAVPPASRPLAVAPLHFRIQSADATAGSRPGHAPVDCGAERGLRQCAAAAPVVVEMSTSAARGSQSCAH